MDFLRTRKYEFVSQALPADTFAVVNFSGTDGISRIYEFEINLISTQKDVDLDAVLKEAATFTIKSKDGDVPYHGILSRFEQRQAFGKYVFYRTTLVPRVWKLSLNTQSQVFLDKSVGEIIEDTLKGIGLTTDDYELLLQANTADKYKKWPFICQYCETNLNFIMRKMEHEGLYFYFKHTKDKEKITITDTKLGHMDLPEASTLNYHPPSGLETAHRDHVIQTWNCNQKALPQEVVLTDFNYRKPLLEALSHEDVDTEGGHGQTHLYGEHFLSPEEGNRLAKVRAEFYISQKKLFTGRSRIPFVRPGYTFTLQDHYRDDFNQEYLILEVRHQGSQVGLMSSDLRSALSRLESESLYTNSITAIPGDIQFRPERNTPVPRCHGFMNAQVDASDASGSYAEVDEEGRYKVKFPFDLADRDPGKASNWMHMGQPYSGDGDYGLHFPLHKGTEVLLAFNDGNPDRPVIIGAIPNPDKPSIVTSKNETQAVFKTAGGNSITIEDQKDKEQIILYSPQGDSMLRIGASKKKESWWDEAWCNAVPENFKNIGKSFFGKPGYVLDTGGPCAFKLGGGKFEVVVLSGSVQINLGAFDHKFTLGNALDIFVGLKESFFFGGKVDIKYPETWEINNGKVKTWITKLRGGQEEVGAVENDVQVRQEEVHVGLTKEEVRQEILTALQAETTLKQAVTQLVEEKTQAIQTQLKATSEKAELNDSKIGFIRTAVLNHSTKINNMMSSIENSELTVANQATEVKSTETTVSQGGAKIVNFTLVSEG